MRFLRIVLVIGALLVFVGSIFLLTQKWSNAHFVFLIWGIEALILVIGIVFERSHYKTRTTSEKGWIRTKERFVDHKSGKLVDVYFHPKTGERKYVEVK